MITFSSPALWQGAVTGVTTIDFEGLAAPGWWVYYGTPGSVTLGGVTFSTATADLYVVDPAFSTSYYDWGSGAVMSPACTASSSAWRQRSVRSVFSNET